LARLLRNPYSNGCPSFFPVPNFNFRLISQDDEYILYNVVVFQRIVDEFIGKAREKKFIVRDFKWDPELLSNEKKQLLELTTAERDQMVTTLFFNFRTNF
jgi:V-type H+-transporting ATPase subunit C